MENKKLCPFNGMQPCNGQCALYDDTFQECSAAKCFQSRYEDMDAVLSDGDYIEKLADKIADALEPMLEAICNAIGDRG